MDSQNDAEQNDDHPVSRRHRNLAAHTFQSIIDQQIAAAQAEGAFDNLPGAGRPLRREDDTHVPVENRAAYRLLKNAGFAPPWIELQKEIREEQAALAMWRDKQNSLWPRLGGATRARVRREYEQRLREISQLITNYNITTPKGIHQLPLLRLADELSKLGDQGTA